MNELVFVLFRVCDIVIDKKNFGFKFGIWNNILMSNEEFVLVNVGLSCILIVIFVLLNFFVGD